MAPLILHNVPDDELYVGDDGIQRPYAMVWPQQEGGQTAGRPRRAANESGAFGKSTRRSRSKTGTPARKEDPTIAAADKVFSSWLQGQSAQAPGGAPIPQRKQSLGGGVAPQPGLPLDDSSTVPAQTRLTAPKIPTEVILRGYKSGVQQYAAINHFEELAGRICEDYSRDPPPENRRYKSELRDPAFTRRRPLTAEERSKVNKADGGEHWVKVTFESAEAADAAIYASPQSILGHLVYAEPYLGIPPTRDEAVLDTTFTLGDELGGSLRSPTRRRHNPRGSVSTLPRSFATGGIDISPSQSQTSSRTADTTTVTDTTTLSSATVTSGATTLLRPGASVAGVADAAAKTTATESADSLYCREIPTARKVRLLPAEQALLPQLSYTQRVVNRIPFLKWFSGSMIGNEVPRTDAGEFDWERASLYWKMICWLDATFGLFGGEVVNADKDD